MRRRRRDNSSVISLGLLLLIIVLQMCFPLPSFAAEIEGRWSPARKMRFFSRRKENTDTTSYGELGKNSSNYYNGSIHEEEKRLVHTGPNPLHN